MKNRRAKFTGVALALITGAFLLCLILKADIGWFNVYSERVVFLLLFVVTGLTATDGIQSWKNGNGGPKP
jgi:drug/metabolite transporter superfamily protein YnfA